MKKKVSVVIPVYNGEKFIYQSINSALEQEYPEIEIVVVDDASTDRTAQIIHTEYKSLLGSKIIYHRNEQNMERVYSRNKGVQLSSGDIVYFLDYDDLWKKEYIKETVTLFDSFDIVYSFPRTFIDESGNTVRHSSKKIGSVEEIIFSGLIGYPSATAVKKSVYPAYKQEYLMREDWEFFIRSYLEGLKIKILDNDMVMMREHSGRTSRADSFYRATRKVYEDYINLVPAEYRPEFKFHTGETALRYGDILFGWKLVLKAFREKPSLLKNRRKVLSVLKRGVRIDRALSFPNS
ncbi:glycosyltransferase family 2 protein [Persephonella sp.]